MKKKERSYQTILASIAFLLFLIVFSSTVLVAVASAQSSSPTTYAYITISGNSISVIDTATDAVNETINVGNEPYGFAFSPDGTKIYVTKHLSNTVDIIDTDTKYVISTIPVGNGPYGIAISPDGTKAYVANGGSNTISVIDTATKNVTEISVGNSPFGVAVSPDGTNVYVADGSDYKKGSDKEPEYTTDSYVYVIDTKTNNVTKLDIGNSHHHGILVTPDGKKAYVANCIDNTVSIINTSTYAVKTVEVGTSVYGVAVTPDGTKVYATNCGSNNTSVIDTTTDRVIATVDVGGWPSGVAVTPDGKKVYVVNSGSNNISIIDTEKNEVTAAIENLIGASAFGQFIGSTSVQDSILPTADFSTNVTSGYYPLSVLFTDFSQNATSRSWDVNGDGVEDSNEPSFVYVYTSRGTYEAKLTVSNANGTASKTTLIDVERKSSGGSSGGGGGGGGSPEPAKNVEVKELSQVFVTNGKTAKFDFTKNATCVVYVSFDAKKNLGKITTIAEQLKNKSALVSELPAGEVYKSFNVWVGNGGIASSKNVENPVICFKVEKAWLEDNNIDKDSITLNRYSDKTWEQLPVSLLSEDSTYMYYTADVPGYSFFAIIGVSKDTNGYVTKEETGAEEPINTETVTGESTSVKTEIETESEKTNGDSKNILEYINTVAGVICAFAALIGIFIERDKIAAVIKGKNPKQKWK